MDRAVFKCEVRYQIYSGKNPLKMKATGKFAYRPAFVVNDRELHLHVFDALCRKKIRKLSVEEGYNCYTDLAGNRWTRVK